jgi:hypothetical protein
MLPFKFQILHPKGIAGFDVEKKEMDQNLFGLTVLIHKNRVNTNGLNW